MGPAGRVALDGRGGGGWRRGGGGTARGTADARSWRRPTRRCTPQPTRRGQGVVQARRWRPKAAARGRPQAVRRAQRDALLGLWVERYGVTIAASGPTWDGCAARTGRRGGGSGGGCARARWTPRRARGAAHPLRRRGRSSSSRRATVGGATCAAAVLGQADVLAVGGGGETGGDGCKCHLRKLGPHKRRPSPAPASLPAAQFAAADSRPVLAGRAESATGARAATEAAAFALDSQKLKIFGAPREDVQRRPPRLLGVEALRPTTDPTAPAQGRSSCRCAAARAAAAARFASWHRPQPMTSSGAGPRGAVAHIGRCGGCGDACAANRGSRHYNPPGWRVTWWDPGPLPGADVNTGMWRAVMPGTFRCFAPFSLIAPRAAAWSVPPRPGDALAHMARIAAVACLPSCSPTRGLTGGLHKHPPRPPRWCTCNGYP